MQSNKLDQDKLEKKLAEASEFDDIQSVMNEIESLYLKDEADLHSPTTFKEAISNPEYARFNTSYNRKLDNLKRQKIDFFIRNSESQDAKDRAQEIRNNMETYRQLKNKFSRKISNLRRKEEMKNAKEIKKHKVAFEDDPTSDIQQWPSLETDEVHTLCSEDGREVQPHWIKIRAKDREELKAMRSMLDTDERIYEDNGMWNFQNRNHDDPPEHKWFIHIEGDQYLHALKIHKDFDDILIEKQRWFYYKSTGMGCNKDVYLSKRKVQS